MLDGVAIASGIVAGAAGDQATHFIDRATGQDELHGNALAVMIAHLKSIDEALSIDAAPNEPLSIQLQPYPGGYQIPHHDRKHVCLFISSGIAGQWNAFRPQKSAILLYLEIPGAGTHIRSVRAGWTQLDLPIGTTIATADGQSYPALISYRNDPINDVIEEPLSALTMTLNTPSTGVNTDTFVTFAGQAEQAMISNTSAGNILYEFNSATTSASDVLAAGQKLFVQDLGILTIHLQAPVDTPLNAASGIIIRGWA